MTPNIVVYRRRDARRNQGSTWMMSASNINILLSMSDLTAEESMYDQVAGSDARVIRGIRELEHPQENSKEEAQVKDYVARATTIRTELVESGDR